VGLRIERSPDPSEQCPGCGMEELPHLDGCRFAGLSIAEARERFRRGRGSGSGAI
jgi:hypothetical protein